MRHVLELQFHFQATLYSLRKADFHDFLLDKEATDVNSVVQGPSSQQLLLAYVTFGWAQARKIP